MAPVPPRPSRHSATPANRAILRAAGTQTWSNARDASEATGIPPPPDQGNSFRKATGWQRERLAHLRTAVLRNPVIPGLTIGS